MCIVCAMTASQEFAASSSHTPDVVVRPAAGAAFGLQEFIEFFDWALFDATVSNTSSTGFTLTGNSPDGQLVAQVTGTGLTFLGPVPFSGTISNIDVSLGGAPLGTISGGISVSALRSAVQAEVLGGNPLAIENHLMGLSWDFQSTDAPVNAPQGTLIGDGAEFNLRGDDIFTLGAGDDNLFAGDGEDLVYGGAGNDILDGGKGNDRLFGEDGDDVLIGGEGNDWLDGGSGGNVLYGGSGDNTMIVRSLSDFVIVSEVFAPEFGFGGTNTVISYADVWVDWYASADRVEVAEDNPHAIAGVIHGSNDGTLVGSSGSEILFGFGGNVTYMAGDGVDFLGLSRFLEGDTGAHTVVVEVSAAGFSWDVIFAFEVGKDKVDLTDYGYTSREEALTYAFDDGATGFYVLLGDLDRPDILYLADVGFDQIDAIDFIV